HYKHIVYLRTLRQDGRKQNEGTHKSIEAVVARLEKQNGMSLSSNSSPEATFMETSERMNNMDDAVVPRVLYEELLRSYQQQQEEMRHIQQELERTRRQLVQQAKKLKEYGTLVSEMKELRDLNRRLQDVLLLRLGSGKYLDIQPKTLLPHLDNQSPDRGTVIPCFSNELPTLSRKLRRIQNGRQDLKPGSIAKWQPVKLFQPRCYAQLIGMAWEVLLNRTLILTRIQEASKAVPKPEQPRRRAPSRCSSLGTAARKPLQGSGVPSPRCPAEASKAIPKPEQRDGGL
ncbi:Hypothetical predicted protein, partial [Podarcis lilfordi]